MKDRRAVALKYSREEGAPRIVAKGRDTLADLILRIAREHGVHVEDHQALAEALMQFEVGELIPEEVYEIVAQILAFVYRLNREKADGNEKNTGT